MPRNVVFYQLGPQNLENIDFGQKNRFFDLKTPQKWLGGVENRYFLPKKGVFCQKKSYCINFVAQKHQKSRFLPEKSIFRGFRPPEHVRMAQNGLKIDSTAYIGLYEGGGPHAHWRITPFDFLTVEAQSTTSIT